MGKDFEDFRTSQRVYSNSLVVVAARPVSGYRLQDVSHNSYLRIMTSSSAKPFSPGKRWMLTELTILPPNLCIWNSGKCLLPRRRVDVDPSSDAQGERFGVDSRSKGSALSTSVGREVGESS